MNATQVPCSVGEKSHHGANGMARLASDNKSPACRSPLRVGFVLHAMQVAGAEVLVAETIRRLGHQIEPTIICLDGVGLLGERIRTEGVELVNLGRRPGRDWGVAWRMARVLRGRDIQVLHAHQYSPFFYAALARVLAGRSVALILTEHGRHFPDVVSPLRRGINRLVLDNLADEVNAVCQFSARSLNRIDGFRGGRIEIIENGIDLPRYQTVTDRRLLRQRLGLQVDRRYLINVARFHPIKDHSSLLRGFASVAAVRTDVDLLLAGDGPLRDELERLADSLGIRQRVRFLGIRSDVPELLQASDVFLLTSICEAASLTLLEAMAAGLPVIVTDVGGNPEIVRDGTEGLLVPRGDSAAIAAAIGQLLDNPPRAEAMGEAGRSRVGQRYQLDRTIASYFQMYQRLAGRGDPLPSRDKGAAS
jgi:L-malate glycosyltransferase